MNSKKSFDRKNVDWFITIVPVLIIVGLAAIFSVFPEQTNTVLGQVRFFIGDTFGVYYLIIGLGILLVSFYLAFSKFGEIRLGKLDEKPQYSFFAWGSMMFTCGLAADILFYSFSEWAMYATNPHISELGSVQEWAGVFPLFHWSFILGLFTLCWLWRLALCFTLEIEASKNTPKLADLYLVSIRMVFLAVS